MRLQSVDTLHTKPAQQLFPYHLADYVCRVMRVQPFKYYCDVLFASLRDQRQYDQLPNFTVCSDHQRLPTQEPICQLNKHHVPHRLQTSFAMSASAATSTSPSSTNASRKS